MDNREQIINATVAIIEEKGDKIAEITLRDISSRAGVGLGLINYHFISKEKLIEVCVERIVNGIVERFESIREETENLSPFDKLLYLGNMTLRYLSEHEAISRISILTDMQTPKTSDNILKTYYAYLPLVSALHPDWDEDKTRRKTFILITSMQQLFLRYSVLSDALNIKNETIYEMHEKMLHDIMEA